jgi:hypothetical protein
MAPVSPPDLPKRQGKNNTLQFAGQQLDIPVESLHDAAGK